MTETEIARSMTMFLTEKTDNYGRRGVPPIEEEVQREIRLMMVRIAHEVVIANPELETVIRGMVEGAVSEAIRNEDALHEKIVDAVAKTLVARRNKADYDEDR